MDNGDGAPKVREPVVWVLMRLGVDIPRSLGTRRLSARGNYLLGMGARVRGLLVIPRPSQEVHDKGPHEGLTRDEIQESYRLSCSFGRTKDSDLRFLIENDLSNNFDLLF